MSKGRTRALPDVSGGGECYDRFGVVVGEGVVEHGSGVGRILLSLGVHSRHYFSWPNGWFVRRDPR